MFKPTPIDELRRPHPDQQRIDAESALLLRKTLEQRLNRIYQRPPPLPAGIAGGKSEPR